MRTSGSSSSPNVSMAAVALAAVICGTHARAETIIMHSLPSPPVLDGVGTEWRDVPGTTVLLHKTRPDATTAVAQVDITGGVYSDHVYFYIQWDDPTRDIVHKPWVWDEDKGKYVKGPQREDRLALQFAMGGDYSTDWRSGKEFVADMWHWKASRSNPLALVHDKSTTISTSKLLRAAKIRSSDGKDVYIARPSDGGDQLYRTTRYRKYVGDQMPKYLLVKERPRGSVADVPAQGIWKAGKWHLEIGRKRDTGQPDDVVFPAKGESVVGGIAVFDHSDNDDHAISETLTFQF